MPDLKQLDVQYITNQTGEKTAVVLSMEDFQELLEDIEDLATVAERRDEPTVSHEAALAESREMPRPSLKHWKQSCFMSTALLVQPDVTVPTR